MSESMRGTRLGALSYETDAHVVPAESLAITYACPQGHRTVVPYFIEAEEIPYEWSCRCGQIAIRPDVDRPEEKPAKHQRTHWDMLLERRTIADLEVLLQERLELLHTQRGEALPKSA
ncbi:MAG: RNA polymerase-binding protein RbpA [Candidatus Nanopelagicales bacterium]|jgi:hypothetical protein